MKYKILKISKPIDTEEDLTIAQHLQKIGSIENQIIINLFNDLQTQIMGSIKIMSEIDDQIQFITLLYTIENELKTIESERPY